MRHRKGKRKLSASDSKGENPGNDNAIPQPTGGFFADLVMALRFFSRLPTGSTAHETPDLNRIAMALPFASLIIAVIPAALLLLLAGGGVSPLFAAFVALAASAIVSGAMSEDAVADAFDGLFGGTTRERRLEILKDSRHGTYGVLAIVVSVGLRAAALAAIAAVSPLGAALCWLGASVLSRSGGLYLALALPPARSTGAAATAGQVSRNAFALGLVFAVLIGLALAGPFAGLGGFAVAIVLSAAMVVAWVWICRKLVNGQTGDLIGALMALLEIAILGTFMRIVAG